MTVSVLQFNVKIEPTVASSRNNLIGDYILSRTQTSLQLSRPDCSGCLHEWPYNNIRKFGQIKNVFCLEAGRDCTTGEGQFAFLTLDSERLVNAVREACKR